MDTQLVEIIIEDGAVQKVRFPNGAVYPTEVKIKDYDNKKAGMAEVESGERPKDHWMVIFRNT